MFLVFIPSVNKLLFLLASITICFVAVVQLLSRVQLSATPWTAAHQASLSFTISQSLLKLMSIELVIPSKNIIICHPLLLPTIFPSLGEISWLISWQLVGSSH